MRKARPSVAPASRSRAREPAGSRAVTTNDLGYYSVSALPAGNYHVEISQKGFKKAARDLELQVAQLAVVDFQLEVGAQIANGFSGSGRPSFEYGRFLDRRGFGSQANRGDAAERPQLHPACLARTGRYPWQPATLRVRPAMRKLSVTDKKAARHWS